MARYPHHRLWTAGRLWWAISMGVAALASVTIPYVPLGFAIWLSLTVAAWAWPNPTQAILPDARGYTFALRMRQSQMRRTLIGRNRALYRLGPRKKDEGGDHVEPRQVACASLGAVCVAGVFVGVDLLVSHVLHKANLVEVGAFAPSYRLAWASVASGTFGWIVGHALAELSRASAAGIETGEQCPPALMPRGPGWPPLSDPVIRALRAVGVRIRARRSNKDEGDKTEGFDPDFRPVFDEDGNPMGGRRPPTPPGHPRGERPLPRELATDEPPREPKRRRVQALVARFKNSLPWDLLRLVRHITAPWSTRFVMGLLALVFVVGLSMYPSPWVSVPGVVVLVSGAVLGWSGRRAFVGVVVEQRKDWFYHREQRQRWHQLWMSMPGANELTAPVYSQEVNFPVGHPEPTHRKVLFGMPSGRDFTDYVKAAPRLATGLDKERVLVEPFQETAGQAHQVGFMVTHELVKLGARAHLGESQDRDTRNFLVRYAVLNALSSLKLGQPLFTEARQITVRRKPIIYESKWIIPEGAIATFDQYVALTPKIAEKLACQWARVYQRPGENHLTILYGARPATTQAVSKNDMKLLHEADWFYWMRSVNLVGTNGLPPRLVRATRNEQGLDELEFALPAGVSRETVLAKMNKLGTASNIPYIREEPQDDPSLLRLVCGEADPLNATYLFRDYLDTMFQEPVKGSPNTDWYIGVGADGELVKYEWGSDEPHLLIAGNTGAGKSAVVNVMLTQLFHNNDPSDLELWMAEPKNELQAYQHLAHVRYFVDGIVTPASPYAALRSMLEAAVEEMEMRNAIFSLHPQKPQKLDRAREIADSGLGSEHLRFPHIIIMIEECADYCKPPKLKEDKDDWMPMLSNIEKLARKARFAGIHIVLATQYPVKENLPSTVKQQSRRIGLRVRDSIASRVVIDEVGLEKINIPGRGFLTGNKGKTEFRALWQDTPSKEHPDIGDIRLDTIAALPHVERWPKLPPGIDPEPTVQENDGSSDPQYLSSTAHEVLDSQTDAAHRAAVLSAMDDDDAPRASEVAPSPPLASDPHLGTSGDPATQELGSIPFVSAPTSPSPDPPVVPMVTPAIEDTESMGVSPAMLAKAPLDASLSVNRDVLGPPPSGADATRPGDGDANAPDQAAGRVDVPPVTRTPADTVGGAAPVARGSRPLNDESPAVPRAADLRALLPTTAPPMPDALGEAPAPPPTPPVIERPAVSPPAPFTSVAPRAEVGATPPPMPPVVVPGGEQDEITMQQQAQLLRAARQRAP